MECTDCRTRTFIQSREIGMSQHLHILGIGGTFMSGLAILAKAQGYHVTGCDEGCYPPISDLLKAQGIEWVEGYEPNAQAASADCIIVGNAMKRGMPMIEWLLNSGRPYTSGPQWLAEHILSQYQVIAVAGTHGKTTTTSMLAYILEQAGLQPGFLIGGVAPAFGTNARLGQGAWFVIEADEYDSAFFDKRPKFMHYRPKIAILNNLEFDHADIYPDLAAIQQQFHYFLRTIPSQGIVIKPRDDAALNEVVSRGCFSKLQNTALTGEADFTAKLLKASGENFEVCHQAERGRVAWPVLGRINVENALSAIAAAYYVDVPIQQAASVLCEFKPVKRRLEVIHQQNGIVVYDDFAHHPTAIAKTLAALQVSQKHPRILLVLELASNSMRSGVHAQKMQQAMALPDMAFILKPTQFDLTPYAGTWSCPYQILPDTQAIAEAVKAKVRPGDAIVIMSNRGFGQMKAQMMEQLMSPSI